MTAKRNVPSVSVTYNRTGKTAKANELGTRPMQERAYEQRGEQYLLLKSPPTSGKSRALLFIALDKLPIRTGVRHSSLCRNVRSGRASAMNR